MIPSETLGQHVTPDVVDGTAQQEDIVWHPTGKLRHHAIAKAAAVARHFEADLYGRMGRLESRN